MKWLLLAVAIMSVAPLTAWLRGDRTNAVKIWVAMGVFLFLIDPLHLSMALVSWATWPGFGRGFEITLIDIFGVAIYMSLPRSRNQIPFRIVAAAYLASVSISAFQANVSEASLFYVWQLIRMFFLFAVTAKASADDARIPQAILKGMAIGLCLELCVAIWQHFDVGEIQASGTFVHQNLLGMATHFVVFPLFALLLAGKRGWEPVVVPIVGVFIALLTASRATLGLGAFGYATTFAISALRKWTSRKGVFAIAGAVVLLGLLPLAMFMLNSRFSVNPLSDDYDERAAFQSAAEAILSDHPMGVGANNYVVVANMQGYNERAGVIPTAGSLGAHVHNVYLLVAAETGYLGLVTFVLLLLQPLVVAVVWGWRARDRIVGDLLLGLGVSLLTVYVHSFYEWALVTYHLQYFVAVQSGMIVGLAQQVGYRRRAKVGVSRLAPEGSN